MAKTTYEQRQTAKIEKISALAARLAAKKINQKQYDAELAEIMAAKGKKPFGIEYVAATGKIPAGHRIGGEDHTGVNRKSIFLSVGMLNAIRHSDDVRNEVMSLISAVEAEK